MISNIIPSLVISYLVKESGHKVSKTRLNHITYLLAKEGFPFFSFMLDKDMLYSKELSDALNIAVNLGMLKIVFDDDIYYVYDSDYNNVLNKGITEDMRDKIINVVNKYKNLNDFDIHLYALYLYFKSYFNVSDEDLEDIIFKLLGVYLKPTLDKLKESKDGIQENKEG